MKKISLIALMLVLTVSLLTGCRGNVANDTTVPSTSTITPSTTRPVPMPSTHATHPSTNDTMPGMDDMIPGTDDTIDPTNGANKSTDETGARSRGRSIPRY